MSLNRRKWRGKLTCLDAEKPSKSDPDAPDGNTFRWRGRTLGRTATLTVDGREFDTSIDHLHEVTKIGVGQFGTVKMVRLLMGPVKRELATKEIQVQDTDGASTKTICKELDILSTSINKYIVEYHGCFYCDQSIVIVMELMHYGSFDKIYQQVGHIREDVVGMIMYSIITGLSYLHSVLNVIHRDMKPSNVLLNQNGHVKICDFGVSRPESAKPMSHVGCRNYMAPERIEPKEGVQYDFKSDIWSLGITAYELLEARYPWKEKQNKYFELLKAITQGPTPRLSPGATENSQDFVYSCLRKNPLDRPDFQGLLDSPFLAHFDDSGATTNLSAWIKEVALEQITTIAR